MILSKNLVCCAAMMLASTSVAAAQDSDDINGTLVLTFENDLFAVTDRNYSNGVKASFTAPANQLPRFVDRGIDRLGLRADGRDWYATYGIGQRIFTPTDIVARTPDPSDHPYAGHAYLSFALSSVTASRLDSVRVEIGVTGEASLAEQTQKVVHSIVGADRPNGWGSQLPTAPTIGIGYEYAGKYGADVTGFGLFDLRAEVLPRATATLGTFDTYAGVGVGMRIGDNFADDFGPAHIRPGVVGSGVFRPTPGFGWSLFAGLDARLVARAGAIEGALFKGGGDVRANRAVAEASFGATISYDWAEISYAHVIRSETFDRQDGTHQFGAVNLRVRF